MAIDRTYRFFVHGVFLKSDQVNANLIMFATSLKIS
jgi:hypothetical protein